MKLFIAFGVCVAFSSAFAQDPPKKVEDTKAADEVPPPTATVPAAPSAPAAKKAEEPKKIEWYRATVITDGGTVYSSPDFDASVSDYLSFKTQILASRKALPGQGGLGLFHRVRYNKDKSGFMADTDLKIDKESAVGSGASPDKPPGKGRKPRSKALSEEEEARKREPLYFSRQAGAAVAMVDFSEKFSGRKLHSNILMYGLRLTGPDILIGAPLDINFWFSLQKPGYYTEFAKSVNGFMLFGDIKMMLPLAEFRNGLINYGLGMMWAYTSYKVDIRNTPFDSKEFHLGADFSLGYAHRFGHFVVRTDVNYYFERTQYFGYMLSFQSEF